MSENTAALGMAQAHVELRRARIRDAVARPLDAAPLEPLAPERISSLCREAEDLYWNELAWEELTDEEAVAGGHLTEMVFPGFLAFVDGLMIDSVPADSPAPPRPRPDAVEAILGFLAERYAELSLDLEGGADSERMVWARAMTARLVDLVLYRLYRLSASEQEELDQLG